MSTLRNFHVPLSEKLYQQLQEETRRQHKPATQLARQAIATWLRQQRETTLHDAIRHYAEQMAGTEADLDLELEAAAVEQLLQDDPYAGYRVFSWRAASASGRKKLSGRLASGRKP